MNCKLKYSRRILSKQSRIPKQKKEEGHLISGYHSQKMSASQWSGKAGIQCLQEYPIFSLFILTTWLNSPLKKATRDTCDSHNHTSPEQPSRKKKSGPEILEIRKSYLSGHGNWRWSRHCLLINWKLQQPTRHLTITCARGRGLKGQGHPTSVFRKYLFGKRFEI